MARSNPEPAARPSTPNPGRRPVCSSPGQPVAPPTPVSLSPQTLPQTPLLLPATTLFTHFISYALPIFYSLLFGVPTPDPRPNPSPSDPLILRYPTPLQTLTKEQADGTWKLLRQVISSIDWEVGQESSAMLLTQSATRQEPEARCTRCSGRPLAHIGLAGFGSTITTSKELLNDLETAVQAGQDLEAQWQSFRLAVVWLHEFSHVIEFAVVADGDTRVFVGAHAQTSEVGFEVERLMFGGHFSLAEKASVGCVGSWNEEQYTEGNAEVRMIEWPDVAMLQAYELAGWNVESRGMEKAEEEAKKWALSWRVDWVYIERMFDPGLWAEESAMRSRDALRVVKKACVLEPPIAGMVFTDAQWEVVKREVRQKYPGLQ